MTKNTAIHYTPETRQMIDDGLNAVSNLPTGVEASLHSYLAGAMSADEACALWTEYLVGLGADIDDGTLSDQCFGKSLVEQDLMLIERFVVLCNRRGLQGKTYLWHLPDQVKQLYRRLDLFDGIAK